MSMDVKEFLIKKHGYDSKSAEALLCDIENVQEYLKPAFQEWIATGIESNVGETHGFTIQRLMDDYKMNYPAALITFNWILEDGQKAVKLLKRGIK